LLSGWLSDLCAAEETVVEPWAQKELAKAGIFTFPLRSKAKAEQSKSGCLPQGGASLAIKMI